MLKSGCKHDREQNYLTVFEKQDKRKDYLSYTDLFLIAFSTPFPFRELVVQTDEAKNYSLKKKQTRAYLQNMHREKLR